MKCPNCNAQLKEVTVRIQGTDELVKSYQCPSCDYVEFEAQTAKKAILELKAKEGPLRIRQKIIKISSGRLGIYLNKHVVESLHLKSGKEISVSVPDKKHILLSLE